MSNYIPFDSHLYSNIWEPLAELLNQESGKNWRTLAHELQYTVVQIKNLETLQRCGGSNTLKLFENYVNRGEEHSLEEVLEALRRIGRKDCTRIIESQIESIRDEYRERQSQISQRHSNSDGCVKQGPISPQDCSPRGVSPQDYGQFNKQGPFSPSRQSNIQDNTVSSGSGEQVNDIVNVNSPRGLQNMNHSPKMGMNNNVYDGDKNMIDASNSDINGQNVCKAVEHSDGSPHIPYSSQVSVTMTTQDAVIKVVVEKKEKSSSAEQGPHDEINHPTSPNSTHRSRPNNEPVQNSYPSMMELLNSENNTSENGVSYYSQADMNSQRKQYMNETSPTSSVFTPFTKPSRFNSTSGGSVTVVKSSPTYPVNQRGGIPVPILGNLSLDFGETNQNLKVEERPGCANSAKCETPPNDEAQLRRKEPVYQRGDSLDSSTKPKVIVKSPKLNPLPPMSSFLVQSQDMSNVGAEVEVDRSPTRMEEPMNIDPSYELMQESPVLSPVFPITDANSNNNSLDLESIYSNFSPSLIKMEGLSESDVTSTSSTKGYNGTLWQLNHATDPQNINQHVCHHGNPNIDHTKYAMKIPSPRQPYDKHTQAYKPGLSKLNQYGDSYQRNGHHPQRSTKGYPTHLNQVEAGPSGIVKPKERANTFPKYLSNTLTHASKITPAESTPVNVGTGTMKRVSRGARILVTYSCDNQEHEKRVLQLCECLRDNNFACSAQMLEKFVERNDLKNWMDTRFAKAHIILVCISPKYASDVTNRQNTNIISNPTRYLYQKMLQEYQQRQNNNLRFVPVLFPGGEMKHIPRWMVVPAAGGDNVTSKKSIIHKWPQGYRDLFFHVEQRYFNLWVPK